MNFSFLKPSVKKYVVVCVLCPVSCAFFAGCGFVKKMQHLPQLLTLKRHSEEQAEISQEVVEQNQRFDRLAASIKDGSFEKYTGAVDVRRDFGSPVFSRVVERDSRPVEEWLYRYATEFKDTDKVYLYFDFKGALLDSVYEQANIKQ